MFNEEGALWQNRVNHEGDERKITGISQQTNARKGGGRSGRRYEKEIDACS